MKVNTNQTLFCAEADDITTREEKRQNMQYDNINDTNHNKLCKNGGELREVASSCSTSDTRGSSQTRWYVMNYENTDILFQQWNISVVICGRAIYRNG